MSYLSQHVHDFYTEFFGMLKRLINSILSLSTTLIIAPVLLTVISLLTVMFINTNAYPRLREIWKVSFIGVGLAITACLTYTLFPEYANTCRKKLRKRTDAVRNTQW